MTRPFIKIRPTSHGTRSTTPWRLAAVLLLLPVLSSCGVKEAKPVDPTAEIQRGWELFRRAEFAPASVAFESAIAACPPLDTKRLEALYGLGIVSSLRRPDEDLQKARDSFQQIIASAPTSDLAAWSALELAQDPAVGTDPDARAAALLEVFHRYPESLAGQQAFMTFQGQRLGQPYHVQESLGQLQDFTQRFPKSTLQFAAWNLMADGLETSGKPLECIRARIRAVEAAESPATAISFDRATAFWGIAYMAEYQLGDFETARKYYNRLINELPGDARIGWAKIELHRMDEADAGLPTVKAAAVDLKRSP